MNYVQWLFSHQDDIFAIISSLKNMASDFPGFPGGARILSSTESKEQAAAVYQELVDVIESLPAGEFDEDHPTIVSLGIFRRNPDEPVSGKKFDGTLLRALLPYLKDLLPLILQLIASQKPAA